MKQQLEGGKHSLTDLPFSSGCLADQLFFSRIQFLSLCINGAIVLQYFILVVSVVFSSDL